MVDLGTAAPAPPSLDPWARVLLDASPDAILAVDADGIVLFANARAERAWAARSLICVGGPLQALFDAGSGRAFRSDLADVLRAPPSVAPHAPRERHAPGSEGERCTFEVSLTRVEGGEGIPSGAAAVVVLRDVTDAIRERDGHAAALAAAAAARRRMEMLLDFAPAFILAVGRDGGIEFINQTVPGIAKEDVIGLPWLQFSPPERHAVMQSALATVLATGTVQRFETATTDEGEGTLWFESHIAPIRHAGAITGAVIVAQDVTEKKLAHAELLAGRHMALLGSLAAGVAHEINTPIQYVGDSIQFLRNTARSLLELIEKLQALRQEAVAGRPMDETSRAATEVEEDADLPYIRENMPLAFESCIEGMNRVATIVRSLKDFAHPSGAKMAASDLNRAVESALTIATNEYKLVADLQTDLGPLPPVICHASEIGQVVLNIVVNAAHAIQEVVGDSGRKGLIRVATQRDGDHVTITISDTGGGISDEHRSRIFDPFFTTKAVGKGTGQGLAIAWSTVKERHGGELTFASKVGEGTTFSIRLPVAGVGAVTRNGRSLTPPQARASAFVAR